MGSEGPAGRQAGKKAFSSLASGVPTQRAGLCVKSFPVPTEVRQDEHAIIRSSRPESAGLRRPGSVPGLAGFHLNASSRGWKEDELLPWPIAGYKWRPFLQACRNPPNPFLSRRPRSGCLRVAESTQKALSRGQGSERGPTGSHRAPRGPTRCQRGPRTM
ncbi:uncharacterized protein AB9W97_003852 isoform 2-T7 [Spinachia spinachia]